MPAPILQLEKATIRFGGLTAVNALETRRLKRAVVTMCIGVGQGIAMLVERV